MARRRHIPHWVYFLIDDGKIVYIGCTANLLQRMKGHKNKKHNAVRVFKFKMKCQALWFERRWTKFFVPHPKYNRFPFYYAEDEIARIKRLGWSPYIRSRKEELV